MPQDPKVQEHVNKLNAYVDRLNASHAGLASDIQSALDTITRLQATQGQVTPEDQALIDEAQAKLEAIVEKMEKLDSDNPPPPPPPPPPAEPPTGGNPTPAGRR